MIRSTDSREGAARTTPRTTRTCAAIRGTTLIEGLFAASMAVTGLLVLSSSLGRTDVGRLAVQQEMTATATLSKAAGTLRAHGITASFKSYSPNRAGLPFPSDGSGPGPHIVAPGLVDVTDPTRPAEVSIRFFTDETADRPELGLPRDLDGDGLASNADISRAGQNGRLMATTLPYALTLRFRGARGEPRSVVWNGVLSDVR